MEKKKLLLVAVSVGIFLIIVIGLSILIFLPKNKEPVANSRVVSRGASDSSPSTGSSPQTVPDSSNSAGINPEIIPPSGLERREPATVDAVDMLRNREELQGLQAPPASRNNGSSLVIEVPRPSGLTVPNSAPESRTSSSQNVNAGDLTRAAAVQTPPSNITIPQQSIPISSPAVVAPRPVKPTEVSKPAASVPAAVKPPVQSSKLYDDYWVQAGSFSTLVRAEDVKNTLADKGITSRIENRDVNGRNVFRVRVGPYTSRREADYWLALIKTINGFEGSQIWQSQAER